MKTISKKTIYILAVIAFILINYLLSLTTLRLDFSKGKAYTLSDSTRSLLRNLKEPINITFYSSSILPSKLQPVKREVSDLILEYKKAGGSKIIIATKDPKKDDKAKKEADAAGIPELRFSQQESDQYAVTSGYFGIDVYKKDKSAPIPQVANVADLEYNITSSVYKISNTALPKVGVVGADNPEVQYNAFRQLGLSQFQVEDVATPDAGFKAVVVTDSRTKAYSQEELNTLEKYIEDGGKAIFMVDGTWTSGDLNATKATHGLNPLLKKFGITLNQNLLLSTASELVNFGGGQGGFQILTGYPYWVRAQTFNPDSSYFSNIRRISFPWVSSLTLTPTKDVKPLWMVKTARSTWEQTKDFTLNPQNIKQPNAKDFKEYIVMASVKLKNGGQITVIPSSRFVEDQYVSQQSDNLELTMNILSDYAAGGALSGIRQRSVDLYPLPPDMSNQQKDMLKYLTILLLPALFAGFGIYRLAKRK